MLKQLTKQVYSKLPLVRELLQIRDLTININEVRHQLNELLRWQKATFQLEALKLFDFEISANPRYQDPKRLHTNAYQVCSQNREDGMIAAIFDRIGTCSRNFVEIGVGDGAENNTSFLLSQGWTGYWIDADPGCLAVVEALKRNGEVPPLKAKIQEVNKENIESIFRELSVPDQFDLLSLDIDQNTWHVWEAIEHYSPRVVVIEYNAVIPSHIDWVASYDAQKVWDGSNNYGGSLKAFEHLGQKKGYHLVGCDFLGANAFFVRADLTGSHFAEPFTSENHYEPARFAVQHHRAHRVAMMDKYRQ
jgi:hypothetical protein